MADTTLAVKDAAGATKNLRSRDEGAAGLVNYHVDADRAALLAAIAAVLGSVDGLEALLGGTLAVSASALPLPAGAATQATLASILAKLIAAPATETKQDTIIGFVDGIETALASLLAKVIAAPATEAKQDTLKASVDALFNAIKPATGHAAVTPSDTVDLTTSSRALYIGGAGNIVVTVGGADATYAVTAGQTLNVVASRVKATNTTATGIVSQF